MASIISTPIRKTILKQNNSNLRDEKENRQGVILSVSRKIKHSDDSDEFQSDEWSSTGIKTRSGLPNYVTNSGGGNLRRRQVRTTPGNQPSTPSHVIARRNERERNRVRQVNESFAALRSRIPDYLYDLEAEEKTKQARRKLSKVETLRLAVDYIQQLETLLNIKPEFGSRDLDSDDDPFSSTDNTTVCGKSELESEHEADAMDLSRDGMCQDDDLSSDAQSLEEKPMLSALVSDKIFSTIRMERPFQCDDSSSDLQGLEDASDFNANSPLPNIRQSFPQANLAYPVLFMP